MYACLLYECVRKCVVLVLRAGSFLHCKLRQFAVEEGFGGCWRGIGAQTTKLFHRRGRLWLSHEAEGRKSEECGNGMKQPHVVVSWVLQASAFIMFPDIYSACRGASVLRDQTAVDAVEMFDRAALR